MKEQTKNRVLQVLAWSFTCLATGVVLEFEGGGGTKECPVGTQLPVAYLVQLRADWAFLKQIHGIPQFNELAGVCLNLWVWMQSGGRRGLALKCFTKNKNKKV